MTTAPSCLSEVLQWVGSKQRVGRSHMGSGGQGRDTGKQMGRLGHCTLPGPEIAPSKMRGMSAIMTWTCE